METCVEFLQCCKPQTQPSIFNNRQNKQLEYHGNVTNVFGVPENPQNSFKTKDNGREEEEEGAHTVNWTS